jgi:hypothetical protein
MSKILNLVKNETKYIKLLEENKDFIQKHPEIQEDLELFKIELEKDIKEILITYENNMNNVFDKIDSKYKYENRNFCIGLYSIMQRKLELLKK